MSLEFPPTGVIKDWSAWMAQADKESIVDDIRQQTQTGRPCGSETFLDQLESLLDRTVRHKKPGRKPKKPPTKAQNQSENKENTIRAF